MMAFTGVPRPDVDLGQLVNYRKCRLLEQMSLAAVDGLVLTNPVSLRYAADWREYALFQAHIPTYYLVLRADGHMVFFGAYRSEHEFIDEFRPAHHPNVFDGGLDTVAVARGFGDDIVSVVGRDARLATERVNVPCVEALQAAGFELVDGEPLVERARSIKSELELGCMGHAIDVAQAAMEAMREACQPGVSENELMAILHQVNIANDGDWIDGRMLCSGPRTNPWYQEASSRRIEAGDLLAFDTDMVGPFGYCADISRTWLVGDGKPDAVQRDRYQRALAEIEHNAALLAPGESFRRLAELAFKQPQEFIANRYACPFHGVGMSDEWPRIFHRQDWEAHGYDGHFEPNMVVSVESFVGSDQGGPGVKLEQMYLINQTGAVALSSYPYEQAFLTNCLS